MHYEQSLHIFESCIDLCHKIQLTDVSYGQYCYIVCKNHIIRLKLRDYPSNIINQQLEEVIQLSRENLSRSRKIETSIQLSVSLNLMCDLLSSMEQFDDALRYSIEDVEISRRICAYGSNIDDYVNLVWAIDRLGRIHRSLGDVDAALRQFSESVKLSNYIVNNRGSASDYRILGIENHCLGSIFEITGRLDEALMYIQEFSRLAQLVVHMRGTVRDYIDLSVSYNRQGDILQKQGNMNYAYYKYKKSAIMLVFEVNEKHTVDYFDAMMHCMFKLANNAIYRNLYDEACHYFVHCTNYILLSLKQYKHPNIGKYLPIIRQIKEYYAILHQELQYSQLCIHMDEISSRQIS